MSRLEPTLEPERPVRRIEVITGAGGRRRWTVHDKARMVEETLEPGAAVLVVAPAWADAAAVVRLAPRSAQAERGERRCGPSFIPAMVELASTHRRHRQQAAPMAAIELNIGGVRVRIGEGAKALIVSAVIRALPLGLGPADDHNSCRFRHFELTHFPWLPGAYWRLLYEAHEL